MSDTTSSGSAPQTKRSAPAGAARRIVISLAPATVVGSIVLLCMGFVAVFSLGVILGRGHNPEAEIPNLARIMPGPAPGEMPVVIAPDENADKPGSALSPFAQDENRGVIGQGDLDYREHLKSPQTRQEQPQARVERTPAQQEKRPQTERAEQARTQASGTRESQARREAAVRPEKTAESGAGAPQPPARAPIRPQAAAQPATPGARPKSLDTRVYRYIYQAAAYNDQASCERFTQKLRAAGFAARTAKSESDGKTVYRTLIDFTGRPDDTDALRDNLVRHGVTKALMVSKVPAQ